MGDDQHRAPLGDATHVVLDDALALIVDGARRLVEDEDAWVADQRAGNRDALALPVRQAGAALADDRVVSVRQAEDGLVRASELGSGDDALHRQRRVGERDVSRTSD